jgi:hypothetical protein
MIQVSLGQQEIDLEDVLAIRDLKDINQAQRLLMVRRKKRQAKKQQEQMAMQQQQQQMAMQAEQMKQQMEAQKIQAEAQIEMQKIQAKAQAEIEVSKITHEQRKEIEMIRAQATLGFKTDDQEFKEKIEVLKEDRKDERVTKQAVQQSKLISQRRDRRGELQEQPEDSLEQTITQLLSE